jgi:hypothetical protein
VARGRLSPANARPVGDDAVRIGGPVRWDDRASREAVIEHCYVVQPYGARRQMLARVAPRHQVRLRATLGTARAHTVDVSEFGAAFTLRRGDLALSVPVAASILLPDGRIVAGRFRPVNRLAARRAVRIGGEMEWQDVDWIAALGAAD